MINYAVEYSDKVLSGEIVACEFVKNACTRFKNDLNRDDIYFDLKKAHRALKYIEANRHTKGEWKGELFKLQLWQKFIVFNIFGFYRKNGNRRFNKAYIEVPKKNGKSPLAAAIANYMFHAEDEPAAEIFCAATQLDQARIAFGYSYDMLEQFAKEHEIYKEFDFSNSINNARILYNGDGVSVYKPLAFDEKAKKDGYSVYFALLDEYHAHPTDSMYNILADGMAARRSPLLVAISTAGENKDSPCYKHRNHCIKVLNTALIDDSLFSIIFTTDKDDDWTNPDTWKKANPNFGISVKSDFLESKIAEAKESETKKQTFLIKHLNQWQDHSVGYISTDVWKRCKKDYTEKDLLGQKCYIGVDLASVSDFTSYCLLFPQENDRFRAIWRHYLPEDLLNDMKSEQSAKIRGWVDAGYITLTQGSATDYDYIQQDIEADTSKFDMQFFGYDPYNSAQLIINLIKNGMDEEKMTPVRQGFTISPAIKELERLCIKKPSNFEHDGNPVSAWMLSNVLIKKDNKNNYSMSKADRNSKIDGIAALVNALTVYALNPQPVEDDWSIKRL